MLLAGLVVAHEKANAAFEFLSEELTQNAYSVEVEFSPAANTRSASIDFTALPEFELLAPEGWEPSKPNPQTSFLLSVPGVETLPASVEQLIHVSAEKDAFTFKPVQAGPYGGIQVILDPSKLGQSTEKQRFRLSVDLSSFPKTSTSSEKSQPLNTPDWGLFLNGTPKASSKRKLADSSPIQKAISLLPANSYRATYTSVARLARLQLPDGLTTETLQITQRGSTLPLIPTPNIKPFVFLPQRRDIISDQRDVLFLNESTNDPAVINQREAFSLFDPQSQEVAIQRKALYNENLIYERATPLPIGERFVYYRISRNQTNVLQLPFYDKLASENVDAVFSLLSVNTSANLDPDHYANLTLGAGNPPLAVSWQGRNPYKTPANFSLSLNEFNGRPTTVPFTYNVPIVTNGPTSDIQNLDSIELSWLGYPRVDNQNRLFLELEAPDPEVLDQNRLITVGGLPKNLTPSELIVLEVTDQQNPTQLINVSLFTDTNGFTAVEFEALADDRAFLIELVSNADLPLQIAPAVSLPSVENVSLLKGIYVCPKELLPALQPLLNLRGEGFIVLEPEAAYNAFSGGQESLEAIRQALAYLISEAPAAVDFPAITLVGFATFDQRNYLGLINYPVVPTFVDESIDTSFTIENCVDFPYGLLFGDDNLIDAMVSRLPAKSAAELSNMVGKILAQESIEQELTTTNRAGVFVYDDVSEILVDRPLWEAAWRDTERPFVEIVRTTTDATAEKFQLNSEFQAQPRSAAMVFYMGHGNNTIWAGGKLMTTDDVPTLNTRGGYPFVATFTCLNAYYAFPTSSTTRSLGEAWLLSPLGTGAVASFAPCSVDTYDSQRQMALATMNVLAEDLRPKTIGELITRARLKMAIDRPDLALTNREYLLFGDALSPTTIPQEIVRDAWLFR